MFRRPKRQRETVDLQFDNGTLTHLAHDGDTHAVASSALVTANTAAIASNTSSLASKADQADLTSLQSTVSANTTAILANYDRIASNASQQDLNDLQVVVNNNATDITAAESDISTLQTTVATNTSDIAGKSTITGITESGGNVTAMTIDSTPYSFGGGGGSMAFFKFLTPTGNVTVSNNGLFPLVTAQGSTDGSISSSAFGIRKFGNAVDVTNNNFQLPANSTWIAHINLSVRGDPDVSLRVIETYLQCSNTSSSNKGGSLTSLASFMLSNHNDWTSKVEYTQYSGFCNFTVPSDKTWIQIKQAASLNTGDGSVVWNGVPYGDGNWGGIFFQRLE